MLDVEGREVVALAGDLRAQFEPQFIGNLEIGLNNNGIELGALAANDLIAGGVKGARYAIRPVAGDGVKSIGHRKDAGPDWNLRSS